MLTDDRWPGTLGLSWGLLCLTVWLAGHGAVAGPLALLGLLALATWVLVDR